MNTVNRWISLCACLATLAVAGCGGGSGGYADDNGNPGPQPQPPPSGAAAFVPFVKEQFAATSDQTDAVELNDREFSFDEDEDAYSSMF
jgi:hypothetical protein